MAGADCYMHFEGFTDSLPCSPHPSAVYKEQPYRQAQSPRDLLDLLDIA